MALDPVIGSAIEVGGSGLSSAASFISAERQMNFQRKMSNTAHQREVADMKKAGLNPMLSVMGGSGASAPVGAMVTPENPTKGLAQALVNTRAQRSQQSVNEAQTQQIFKNIAQTMSQTLLTSAQAEREKIALQLDREYSPSMKGLEYDILGNTWSSAKSKAEADLNLPKVSYENYRALKMENDKNQFMKDLYASPYGKYLMPILDKIGPLNIPLGTKRGKK
ncbi:MAG: DNA pilot protein [Arizlama microvirus]|nr:MAG: DNA pilot protein [Arizlama microvirus]